MNAELDMAISELGRVGIKPLVDRHVQALTLDRVAAMAIVDPVRALNCLSAAPDMVAFPYLRAAVIAICAAGLRRREADIRRQFYSRLSTYLPGAQMSARTADAKLMPDGFVIWRAAECPVEVKRTSFDVKARSQLRRYMQHYGCETGIAVAPRLACALPDNMTFVRVEAAP